MQFVSADVNNHCAVSFAIDYPVEGPATLVRKGRSDKWWVCDGSVVTRIDRWASRDQRMSKCGPTIIRKHAKLGVNVRYVVRSRACKRCPAGVPNEVVILRVETIKQVRCSTVSTNSIVGNDCIFQTCGSCVVYTSSTRSYWSRTAVCHVGSYGAVGDIQRGCRVIKNSTAAALRHVSAHGGIDQIHHGTSI